MDTYARWACSCRTRRYTLTWEWPYLLVAVVVLVNGCYFGLLIREFVVNPRSRGDIALYLAPLGFLVLPALAWVLSGCG